MPFRDLGAERQDGRLKPVVDEQIKQSAEFELKPGINIIELPDLLGPEFSSHPFYTPTRTERVPNRKELVLTGMAEFLQKIEQQGGRLIQIIELPYTTNLDRAQHLDDIQSGVIKVALVVKD